MGGSITKKLHFAVVFLIANITPISIKKNMSKIFMHFSSTPDKYTKTILFESNFYYRSALSIIENNISRL
jgi:hypothetical protein